MVGSAGQGKISSATREDYAEAAVVVLSIEEHLGKVYELAGDNYYTLNDLAAEVSNQSGKEIPYNNLPEGEFAKVPTLLGIPESFASVIAGWDVGASKDDLFNDDKVLTNLIGRPTTPFSESVRGALNQQ